MNGSHYDYKAIESKWSRRWEEERAHETPDRDSRKEYYCLDMFPYPSGSGLHVGHWRGYVISDVWARYEKIHGHNVLHPMGWDSFGLPAENDAILRGLHPREGTASNIANMKRQLHEIDAMYDWRREINTSDPSYYKWTQWIFLQMFKRGLAYKRRAPINWCPNCKTGLANEEVVGGVCERCGTEVTRRELDQWMLRITAYADRLADDLDKLDWPEKVKAMQRNWIGRSYGARVIFEAIAPNNQSRHPLPVFTTRPDTLFGATYMVLAPEHGLVSGLTAPDRRAEVKAYVQAALKKSERDRQAEAAGKTGVFLGSEAVNPVNGKAIPIWISDYVLSNVGEGAIMAVPAHDQRDFEFAQKFGLQIVEVIGSPEAKRDSANKLAEAYTGEGALTNSEHFDNLPSEEAREKITSSLAGRGLAEKRKHTKLRDWIYSRQRYWGEPIPMVHCDRCDWVPVKEEDLPVLLPEIERYRPTGTGESPLAAVKEWVNTACPACGGPGRRETDTMPQWAGSSWYFLRYPNPDLATAPFSREDVDRWLPVDCYIGGIEHAILHLLYARFFTKVLYDENLIGFDEPFRLLFNQGMILHYSEKDGKSVKMSKSKGNVVSPDPLIEKYGRGALRLYLLFIGPPEENADWDDNGIVGMYRFLRRAYRLVSESAVRPAERPDEAVLRRRHRLAREVSERLERFQMNTALSAMMEFVNDLSELKGRDTAIDRGTLEAFAILLAPYAPHLGEEMWEILGHKESIFRATWPEYDAALASADEVTIGVQVNGKLRGRVTVPRNAEEKAVVSLALEDPGVAKHIGGRTFVTKYVQNRILNFIIR